MTSSELFSKIKKVCGAETSQDASINVPSSLPCERGQSLNADIIKVYSFEKKQELLNILHSENPDHYSRLHLVGFLKHVGYTCEEICDLIYLEASWEDYDTNVTYCQVSSIFRRDYPSISSRFTKGVEGENAFTKGFSPSVRLRPCSIKWTPCAECPDNSDKGCMWVKK